MNRAPFYFLILILALTACIPQKTAPAGAPNMANPAAVYCEKHGGKEAIREDANGQAGVCTFPDGSYCDEWAFFRGECKPGQPALTVPAAIATLEPAARQPAAANPEGWIVYRDDRSGFTFAYPPIAEAKHGDDPEKTLYISGKDSWPYFEISYPAGRPDFRPPEGADLYQWLSDHNLLGADRQPDVQIAGTTAVHLRHERSPQSFAFDRYYFAHAGQLYQITIGHQDGKEDWQMYNQFLASFQFTEQ